jgi:hypothetical protein
VAAGEVSEEAISACMVWLDEYAKNNDGKLPHIAEAFYAGRAGRDAPSPAPGLEAVKAEVLTLLDELQRIVGERFNELELQGRVLREYVYQQGHYRKWVRLEDEERVRAKA